jgi:cardiolipin synthase (CMP-forming)
MEMPQWLNVPNLFTLVRLLLVPFIVLAILSGDHARALVLFACAAITDILDGAAARHLSLTTPAGAYLDPIADKCLLSGVFLALAGARLIPRWLVAVIFGRDLYILCAAGFLLWLTPIRSFPPSVWGKASTFVQIVTAVVWMGRNTLPSPVLDALSAAMLWPCAAFTIWSGIHYTRRGFQLARAH